MSIVTKTGDQGETSLMYGRRVSKSDPRVEAYGAVDELNAALGLARAASSDEFVSEQILAAQKDLIVLMGELATAHEDRDRYLKDGFKVTSAAMVDRLGAVIVDLEKDKSLYPKDWVIPGGTQVSAALDFARTSARHAERRVAGLTDLNSEILRYLNRLSDLCWVLARYAERTTKSEGGRPKR
jgi:cob(I)alamin adenosyltransferase